MKDPANGTETGKKIRVRCFRVRMQLPEWQKACLHSARYLHGVREHAVNHVIDRLPAGPLQRSGPKRPVSFDQVGQNAVNPFEYLGVLVTVHGAIFVYDPAAWQLGFDLSPHPLVALRATLPGMARDITQRQLRNDSGEIMRALDQGESFVVTRNGVPVGELTPLRRHRFVNADTAIAMFRGAPSVDLGQLRRDLDSVASQDPSPRA